MLSDQLVWFLRCLMCINTLAVGVFATEHRINNGRWPKPHRVGWWRVITEVVSATAGRTRSYLGSWRDEESILRRVAAFLLGFGLTVRASTHSMAYAAFGDGGSPDVDTEFVWHPVGEPSPDTRLALGVIALCLAFMLWSLAPALEWGWPPVVEVALRLWLGANWAILLADFGIGLITFAKHITNIDSAMIPHTGIIGRGDS